MTDYSLEDRIKRRILTELGGITDDYFRDALDEQPDGLTYISDASHLAALEAEDTANPIAATAIVRKDAATEIAPPDVEALLAAFNRLEDDQ